MPTGKVGIEPRSATLEEDALSQGVQGVYGGGRLITRCTRCLWRRTPCHKVYKVSMEEDALPQGVQGVYGGGRLVTRCTRRSVFLDSPQTLGLVEMVNWVVSYSSGPHSWTDPDTWFGGDGELSCELLFRSP